MQEYAVMPGLDEQEERAEEPKTVAPVKEEEEDQEKSCTSS